MTKLSSTGTLIGLTLAVTVAAAGLMTLRDDSTAPAQPPLVMTCPHHPDVIESAPGTCPYCRMALVPVRLAPAWACPFHQATIADAAGTCAICKRQLVPVTVSLTWACPGSTEEHLEQGLCADGSAMALRRALRPHGDHNPRHGGQFFMASDNWHHVEGAYPAERLFRLYVYDDYARPLPLQRLHGVRARVVTEERFDPETRTTTELTAFPLSVGGDGAYLEARVESVPLPAAMTAKVQLTPDHPEQRFDFTFTALSRDPSPASMDTRMSMPAMPALSERAPAPAPGSPVGELRVGEAPDPAAAAEPPMDAGAAAAAPVAAPETAALPAPDPALVALPIPETIPGMLDQLRTRNRQIAELIDRGDLAAVWFPAFQAKDVAVALEARLADLAPSRREATAAALHRLVRLSWLLDAHGDTGNRQNVTDAHAAFSSAVDDVLTSIGRPSR